MKKKQSAADKALVFGESRKRISSINDYAIGLNRAIRHLEVGRKYNVGFKATMGKNVPYEVDTKLVTSKKFGEKPTTGPKAYARARSKSKAMPGDQIAPTGKKKTNRGKA